MKTVRIFAVALLIVASGSALRVAHSQQTAIKRTELQRHDLSIPGREAIQVRGDFPPGAAVPRHTHPGEEIVYVLEGTLEFQLEGQPPVTLKPGEVLFVPAGTIHTAKNVSGGNSAVLSTYIVEKGKPLLTLVQ
jgi:quercetin dioxygenase-like cupin family protein